METPEDKKIQQETSDLEMLRQFGNSHAWKMAKRTLLQKILELDSLSASLESLQKKGIPIAEIKDMLCVNAKVVNMVVDWVNEIEVSAGGRGNVMAEVQENKAEAIIVTVND